MSVTSGPDIIDDNLLIHLDAANDRSYPGTGTIWYDISGLNNNVSLVNGPTFSTDNNGILVFDGVNDHAKINYSGIYNGATFSTWFKTSNLSNYMFIFVKGGLTGNPGTGNGIAVFTPGWAAQSIQIYLNDATGTSKSFINATINQGIRDGNWHNVVVTYNYNGSTSKLISYLDGIPKATGSLNEDRTAFFNLTQEFFLYGNQYIGGYWNGQCSLFQMYNKTLTANEVGRNFNALRGRFGI